MSELIKIYELYRRTCGLSKKEALERAEKQMEMERAERQRQLELQSAEKIRQLELLSAERIRQLELQSAERVRQLELQSEIAQLTRIGS